MNHRNRHRWHEVDSLTLLKELGDFRDRVNKYSPKALFVKPLYAALHELTQAIDAVGGQLTGNKECFWAKHHSAGAVVAEPGVPLVSQEEDREEP